MFVFFSWKWHSIQPTVSRLCLAMVCYEKLSAQLSVQPAATLFKFSSKMSRCWKDNFTNQPLLVHAALSTWATGRNRNGESDKSSAQNGQLGHSNRKPWNLVAVRTLWRLYVLHWPESFLVCLCPSDSVVKEHANANTDGTKAISSSNATW